MQLFRYFGLWFKARRQNVLIYGLILFVILTTNSFIHFTLNAYNPDFLVKVTSDNEDDPIEGLKIDYQGEGEKNHSFLQDYELQLTEIIKSTFTLSTSIIDQSYIFSSDQSLSNPVFSQLIMTGIPEKDYMKIAQSIDINWNQTDKYGIFIHNTNQLFTQLNITDGKQNTKQINLFYSVSLPQVDEFNLGSEYWWESSLSDFTDIGSGVILVPIQRFMINSAKVDIRGYLRLDDETSDYINWSLEGRKEFERFKTQFESIMQQSAVSLIISTNIRTYNTFVTELIFVFFFIIRLLISLFSLILLIKINNIIFDINKTRNEQFIFAGESPIVYCLRYIIRGSAILLPVSIASFILSNFLLNIFENVQPNFLIMKLTISTFINYNILIIATFFIIQILSSISQLGELNYLSRIHVILAKVISTIILLGVGYWMYRTDLIFIQQNVSEAYLILLELLLIGGTVHYVFFKSSGAILNILNILINSEKHIFSYSIISLFRSWFTRTKSKLLIITLALILIQSVFITNQALDLSENQRKIWTVGSTLNFEVNSNSTNEFEIQMENLHSEANYYSYIEIETDFNTSESIISVSEGTVFIGLNYRLDFYDKKVVNSWFSDNKLPSWNSNQVSLSSNLKSGYTSGDSYLIPYRKATNNYSLEILELETINFIDKWPGISRDLSQNKFEDYVFLNFDLLRQTLENTDIRYTVNYVVDTPIDNADSVKEIMREGLGTNIVSVNQLENSFEDLSIELFTVPNILTVLVVLILTLTYQISMSYLNLSNKRFNQDFLLISFGVNKNKLLKRYFMVQSLLSFLLFYLVGLFLFAVVYFGTQTEKVYSNSFLDINPQFYLNNSLFALGGVLVVAFGNVLEYFSLRRINMAETLRFAE